MRFIDVQREIC